ncbi:diguanylate cyclase domain-containing protein [Thiohalomonas denitrificans]|uniref:diguanylate cyclase domain-containing protein n=1 Tax=Thiohalomonas denitrificans TaxID=415747 RepID=UPI0026F25CFF|nr:diguanylate cyclase [Thiohalomonas denitrificans]
MDWQETTCSCRIRQSRLGRLFSLNRTETDADGAHRAVEAIRHQLMQIRLSHGPVVSFSMGVASYQRPPVRPADAVGLADRLMYEAKCRGKNQVVQEEDRSQT